MDAIIDSLWARLQTLLLAYASRISILDSSLKHNLGKSSNECFLLRAFLSFRKDLGDSELAITVDVQTEGQKIIIMSDICTDGGKILVIGPTISISLSSDQSALNNWLSEFKSFLDREETDLIISASILR